MSSADKHIIFVTGYPGAGKTFTVKRLLKLSQHRETWLRQDTPFNDFPIRGLPQHHEVGSAWTLGKDYVVAGCHRKTETNKQGADIFVSMPKYKVIDWLLTKGDILLWDSFDVGPKMLKQLASHRITYVYLDFPREVCMQRRDKRRDDSHHSAKNACDLAHFYDRTERRLQQAIDLGCTVIKTRSPVTQISNLLR